MQSQREMEIWEACNSLKKEGLEPGKISLEKIGHRLVEMSMGPGSMGTRSKYRETWLEDQRRLNGDSLNSVGSSDLIHRSTFLIHQTIEKEIKAEYEAKIQGLKAELSLKAKEFMDLQDELSETESKLTQTKELNRQAHAELDVLKQALLREQRAHSAAQETRVCFEEQLKLMRFDFDRNLAEIKSLHQEALQQAKERYQALEQQAKVDNKVIRDLAEQQQKEFLGRLEKTQEESQKWQSQSEKSQAEFKYQKSQTEALKLSLDQAHAQQFELQQRIESLIKEGQKLERLVVGLENDKQHLEKQRIEEQHKVESLQKSLITSKEQAARWEEATVHLKEELERLKTKAVKKVASA